ncbi:site-specific integrase [Cuniculiplasma sp. SKW4]|uniref:site-specific integrase n=1 Tax=Cuniculiplasma sp. SKW4 TaxID=3400171 RepID=UPI003FD63EF6
MGRERYGYLLKDKDISRWKHSVDAGSTITGDVYLRRMGSFCVEMGKTPQELLRMKDKALVDLIDDYVIKREKMGNAGSYIGNTIKAVKSWLTFNGINLPRKIKIKDVEAAPTLINEGIPTQEELRKIFAAGDSRERTACALVAFSGVRIGVLGNYKGSDGLKIKDIPDLIVDRESVSFKRIPAQVIVRKELSKANNRYFTFIGREGCMYLENYLIERIRSGEELTPESAVITPAKLKIRTKQHISSVNIGDLMRNAIRNAGFTWRPYVLRAYFDSRLLMAQDSRLITRDYRTFFMGHVGDIEHRYTLNKGRLSDDLIEAMRNAYEKSTKYLETDHKGLSEEEVEDKFRKQLLLMAGFSEEEIKEKNMLTMTAEEITKLARDKLLGMGKPDISSQIKKDMEELSKTHKQKVVSIDLIEEYINNGFVVKMALGNDKAIVELP